MSGNTSRGYPPELKQRAVRMVGEIRGEHESGWAAMGRAAELLGVWTPASVRKSFRETRSISASGPGLRRRKPWRSNV
jgi:transposase